MNKFPLSELTTEELIELKELYGQTIKSAHNEIDYGQHKLKERVAFRAAYICYIDCAQGRIPMIEARLKDLETELEKRG